MNSPLARNVFFPSEVLTISSGRQVTSYGRQNTALENNFKENTFYCLPPPPPSPLCSPLWFPAPLPPPPAGVTTAEPAPGVLTPRLSTSSARGGRNRCNRAALCAVFSHLQRPNVRHITRKLEGHFRKLPLKHSIVLLCCAIRSVNTCRLVHWTAGLTDPSGQSRPACNTTPLYCPHSDAGILLKLLSTVEPGILFKDM